MSAERPFLLRPERLIAAARVFLACFSLFAVWLDPTEPAKFASVAYGLLIGYVAYALIVAVYAWRVETLSGRWPIVTQVGDLAFFSLFIFFTAGPGSPFNVYFVFALMCAAIRWQARGAIAIGAVALVVFGCFGVYFHHTQDPAFDPLTFIIRGTYLVVFAVLLAYVGVHEQYVLREMSLLTAWPDTTGGELQPLARAMLSHASTLLGARDVALVWQSADDDVTHVAVSRQQRWEYQLLNNGPPAVHDELLTRAFIFSNLAGGRGLVQADDRTLLPWAGAPLDGRFARMLHSPSSVLSVPSSGARVTARLLVLNKDDVSKDDLVVAGIVTSIIVARLDAIYLNQELRRTAATEERVRLGRDLHDGVLQSFTGVALRLAAIRAMLTQGEPGVVGELDHLQAIIAAEQRELRFYIQDLRPDVVNQRVQLPRRLSDLASRVEREWDIRVLLKADVSLDLPDRLCHEIYHVVREALVNAARHGQAAAASVSVVGDADEGISVSVVDNGRGFSFNGVYSQDELARRGFGPKTLMERVKAMSGSLTLESSPKGASVHIVLPRIA